MDRQAAVAPRRRATLDCAFGWPASTTLSTNGLQRDRGRSAATDNAEILAPFGNGWNSEIEVFILLLSEAKREALECLVNLKKSHSKWPNHLMVIRRNMKFLFMYKQQLNMYASTNKKYQ